MIVINNIKQLNKIILKHLPSHYSHKYIYYNLCGFTVQDDAL